jgi:hypothetical protein
MPNRREQELLKAAMPPLDRVRDERGYTLQEAYSLWLREASVGVPGAGVHLRTQRVGRTGEGAASGEVLV